MPVSVTPTPAVPAKKISATSRLFSLDVFRGATIAAMILVNNPGNDFPYAPAATLTMEWLDPDRSHLPVLPLYCWSIAQPVVPIAAATRRVEADAVIPYLTSQRHYLSYRPVPQRLPLFPSLDLARSRSAATNCPRLSCGGIDCAHVKVARNRHLDCGPAGRLLDRHAIHSSAGLWNAG